MHHAFIIKVTFFVHLVHRKAVTPTAITHRHVFFGVMKAYSVSF